MTVTGDSIVSVAQSHKGVRYKWAGFLPSTGWDCSGAVNYWLGHDLGMALPGGFHWNGKVHGPVAAQYKIWGGSTPTSDPQPGDLCCWQTHVGIYLGGGQMFSAFDSARGTLATPVTWGPAGESLSYRHITAVPGTTDVGVDYETQPVGSAASMAQAAGCVGTAAMLPAMLPYLLARKALQSWRTV